MAQKLPITVITSRRIAVATALLTLSGVKVSEARTLNCDASAAANVRGSDGLSHPDHKLLNATTQAKRLGDYTIATQRGVLTIAAQAAVTEKLRPVYDELDAHLDAVIATPARTLEGLRAKAATAADWFREDLSDDSDDDVDQRIIASLLRDLTGRV